jgi:hypothetical protein
MYLSLGNRKVASLSIPHGKTRYNTMSAAKPQGEGPLSPAPEGREQMAAFRELANQAARFALGLHDRRHLEDRARTMFVLAAGTLLLAGVFAVLAKLGYARTANSALALCGVAIIPASACLWHTVRVQWHARSRRRFADEGM